MIMRAACRARWTSTGPQRTLRILRCVHNEVRHVFHTKSAVPPSSMSDVAPMDQSSRVGPGDTRRCVAPFARCASNVTPAPAASASLELAAADALLTLAQVLPLPGHKVAEGREAAQPAAAQDIEAEVQTGEAVAKAAAAAEAAEAADTRRSQSAEDL